MDAVQKPPTAIQDFEKDQNMDKNSKTSSMPLYASLLAFIAFIAYVLHINQEVLYTAHERSEFLVGADYFQFLMSKPFGLMQYVGAWLTQFFYYPALGAAMLTGIWVLIFLVGKKAFGLREGAIALMLLPIACLLTSVVDLGYWIYISPIRGYWFSQSVGYLLMLLLLWGTRNTPRQWHLCWYLLGICLYPILGWFSLLFVVCLVFSGRFSWRELLGLFLLLFTAAIWQRFLYSGTKPALVTMAGMPRFETPSDKTDDLSLPFWIMGVITMLIPLCGKYLTKGFVPVLSAIAGMVFTYSLMFQDQNYIDEMRITRYAEDDNWEEVLKLAEKNKKPTKPILMLKNVALMYQGGLLERSFKTESSFADTYNPDSVHVSFLEIAAPIAYYNYGLINEGFRLNFECAEQTGFSPCYLKRLARCAYANGEMPLVNRYLAQLHSHPFYADWQPAAASENTRELHASYANELSGTENSFTYLVNSISLWYDSDSKVASEQALFYSMYRCDSQRFWKSIRAFVKTHMDESFPTHAQEAYILYMDKAPEAKRMMIPVSEEIYDRYKQFWASFESLIKEGVNPKEIPGKMYEDYGDTYWYFNIFGRKAIYPRVENNNSYS